MFIWKFVSNLETIQVKLYQRDSTWMQNQLHVENFIYSAVLATNSFIIAEIVVMFCILGLEADPQQTSQIKFSCLQNCCFICVIQEY